MRVAIESNLQRKVNPVAVQIKRKGDSRRSKNRSAVITFKYNQEAMEDLREEAQQFFASHGIILH